MYYLIKNSIEIEILYVYIIVEERAYALPHEEQDRDFICLYHW